MIQPRFVLLLIGLCLLAGSLPAVTATAGSRVLPIVMKRTYQPYQRYVRLAPARPTVTVRKGMKHLVLEQRQGTGWTQVSSQPVQFAPGESAKVIFLQLPANVPLTQLRVVAHDRLPNAPKEPQVFEYPESGYTFNTGVIALPRLDFLVTTNNALAFAAGNVNLVRDAGATIPDVTDTLPPASEAIESDIWQIAGQRLFFFNQYRGLQVIDLSQPENPIRTGGVRLAASGDQMFVLDDTGSFVALVGKAPGRQNSGKSALYLVKVSAAGVPELKKEIVLDAPVVDSRLIGQRLYLLLRQHDPDKPSLTSATLETFDLTRPAAPVRRAKLKFQDATVLQAAGHHLLISGATRKGAARLYLVDTATAGGTPALLKTFLLKGAVQDKFKLGITADAVVAVTKTLNETWVETFPLKGRATAPLAQLEMVGARNESLYATRFDGDRLYVVTFRRIDPLFVVDLADPAAPVVRGILEIPGWSTYLQPMGDRLLAVGLENGLPTVSLFDVADPAAPALLSRLWLADSGLHSSEATWDEKAVEFLPEDGLLMVPCSGWREGRQVNLIQAIQVERDTLTLGRAAEHQGNARRGTVVGDYLVTISGQQLVVVQRSDETGAPKADLSLAWRVDRVVPFGSYLLQIEDGSDASYGYPDRQALLRVSHRNDPDAVVEVIEAGAGPFIGLVEKDQRLYLAQRVPAENTTPAKLRTWILDGSAPPQVREIASLEHDLGGQMPAEAKGLWVNATLVWHLTSNSRLVQPYDRISIIQPIASPAIGLFDIGTITFGTLRLAIIAPPPPAGPATVALLCPIRNAATAPAAGEVIRISSERAYRSGRGVFSVGGCLYASYDEAHPYEGMQLLYGGWYRTIRPQLQVVDFNATPPLPRSPVSIPGELLNVIPAGAGETLIFTQRPKAGEGAEQEMHALTYDGLQALELDSRAVAGLPTDQDAVADTRFYFIQSQRPGVTGLLFDRGLNAFADLGNWSSGSNVFDLKVAGQYLLAAGFGVLETAVIGADSNLAAAAGFDTPVDIVLQIHRLSATPEGLFIPAADYGVEFLPWPGIAGR